MTQLPSQKELLSSLQDSLFLIKKLKNEVAALKRTQAKATEPIAIVGIGCRFPGGADDPAAFWQLLRDGVDAVGEIPSDRWDVEAYYDPTPGTKGKMYVRHGAFLDGVDQFDPLFFGISPREAMSLDPQQRLLLEVSWEALENAGQAPDKLVGSQTGVFVGIGQSDYAQFEVFSGDVERINPYSGTGNGLCFASGRLSYVLGLQGPNMAIDTACSSSLVAVHLACQSLRSGESELALAGGVQLILSPEATIGLSRMQALAPDGRCKTFSADADGYGRGEGCGVIVLKRLSDAQRDGDHILALIRGSAINHDGKSSGLTVPNKLAQEALIRQALANANVQPEEVTYVDAHGTGTPLGDPLELRALAAAYTQGAGSGKRSTSLKIGSVKTNIGHLEAGAGIASLIKVALSLYHGEIPPHLHFNAPNPHLDWDALPLKVPTQRTPWGASERLAGMSSFGLSGTNGHVILSSAPAPSALGKIDAPAGQQGDGRPSRPLHLLTLSAKTEEALKELSERYERHIAANPQLNLADVCFTANTGRAHLSHRMSVIAESLDDVREKLAAARNWQEPIGVYSESITKPPKIAFLFSGQGSQYIDMGRQLYETEPTFRAVIERCDELLRPYLRQPLLSVLYPTHQPTNPLIHQTAYTQPALFALEYALAQLWKSWGVEPDVVIGHSVGELVAACVAGVFTLEEGLKLIAQRGRLMQNTQMGQMVAVSADEASVQAIINQLYGPNDSKYLSTACPVNIAAINGAESVVISGEADEVQRVVAELVQRSRKTKTLKVSHAFHSLLMDPILRPFERIASSVNYSLPQIELISNLTGQLAEHELTTPQYWARHIRQPVRFAAGLETLREQEIDILVEIGPKPILLSMARQSLQAPHLKSLASLRPNTDWQQMLDTLGQLYVSGVPVNWSAFETTEAHRRLPLPTYPWQRERYWTTATRNRPSAIRHPQSAILHPLLHRKFDSPLLEEIYFEAEFSTERFPFLADHRIYSKVVVPGASHISLLLAAAELIPQTSTSGQAFGTQGCRLEEILFPQALVLGDAPAEARTLQLAITPAEREEKGAAVKLISLERIGGSAWKTHATGRISPNVNALSDSSLVVTGLDQIQARCQEVISRSELYQALQKQKIELGPTFQWIDRIWRGEREALCQMRLPHTVGADGAVPLPTEGYQLHPTLIDACFQLLGATISAAEMPNASEEHTFVPFRIAEFRFIKPPTFAESDQESTLWCHATLRAVEEAIFVGDIRLFDHHFNLIAEIIGLESRKISRQSLLRMTQEGWQDWLYEVIWRAEGEGAREQESKGAVISGYPSREEKPLEGMTWLILADQRGIGRLLSEKLSAQGGRTVVVYAGHTYKKVGANEYTVCPSEPAHFQQLLAESLSGAPTAVVHLWSLDDAANASQGDLLTNSCGSALFMVQALTQANMAARLHLITRGSQPVLGSTNASPPVALWQAPLWGLGKVIALEHPELSPICLDLPPDEDEDKDKTRLEESASILVDELLAADKAGAHASRTESEHQVAYRNGTRYVARLVPGTFQRQQSAIYSLSRRNPQSAIRNPQSVPLVRADSSYLITGGLGALGLKVAEWLVSQGARHLLLCGRSTPSEAAQKVINKLEEGGHGVQIAVIQADITNEEAVKRILAANDSSAPLRGIIHAAGVLDDGVLMQQSLARFEKVMAPKIKGAWSLHSASLHIPLDFFVCFSSIASLLGGSGQGNYAAANAFMDALAHHRRALGLPALSINWGPWGEIGMAAHLDTALKAQGIGMIPPASGLQLLGQLLADSDLAQVGVLPVRWAQLESHYPLRAWLSEVIERDAKEERSLGSETRHAKEWSRQLEEASPAERDVLLRAYLHKLVAKTLGVAPLNEEQSLNLFGLDSLMALELRNKIQADLTIDVPVVKFLEGITLASLFHHISQALPIESASSDLAPTRSSQDEPVTPKEDMSAQEAGQMLSQLSEMTYEEKLALLKTMSLG